MQLPEVTWRSLMDTPSSLHWGMEMVQRVIRMDGGRDGLGARHIHVVLDGQDFSLRMKVAHQGGPTTAGCDA